MSRRYQDMQAEHILSNFLDKNFYNNLPNVKFQRIKDKQKQLKGVDVILKFNNVVRNIDEKAALYYINKNIPTFAFELSFLGYNGELREGWFLSSNLVTDYYLLLWVNANTNDLSNIKETDFTKVEAFLVNKYKLIEYLNSLGLTKGNLKTACNLLRENNRTGKIKTEIFGIYYYCSDRTMYSEEPINVVVSKKILEKVASSRYIITQEGYHRLV